MSTHPVSIIVCTHSRANLLSKVIRQLSMQNYAQDSFEIIVVDNRSTDDTPQVTRRLISESKVTLRYVREDRPGVTFARNRGAEESCYPYLAYLDDDCSVGVDWLSQLISGFDLDGQVSVVAGRIAVDYDDQKIPDWLGTKSERWLASYNFPGSKPRLLDNPVYVCEGNMAIKRQAWEAAGGFLGIDQFSSPHMAAQEIVYLLAQIKSQGGKVAFVPGAIADHHIVIPTRQLMLMRAYWHGVSDGILDYLLLCSSGRFILSRVMLDMGAMIVFLCLSLFSFLVRDKPVCMYHLLRATARFGRVLSELRLAGDWHRVRLWASTHTVKL